jgi:hypothetical protein
LELKESDERKPERLVAEMLGKARWSKNELKLRRKGVPKKGRMAASRPWIAGAIDDGSLAKVLSELFFHRVFPGLGRPWD